jgi:predicted DNA-binding protein
MYTPYIMHRTQVYLDDEQDAMLSARAQSSGRTKSSLIREAIDGYLAPVDSEQVALARFRSAVQEASGIAPYLPPGPEYVERLRAADRERQRKLDAQRG